MSDDDGDETNVWAKVRGREQEGTEEVKFSSFTSRLYENPSKYPALAPWQKRTADKSTVFQRAVYRTHAIAVGGKIVYNAIDELLRQIQKSRHLGFSERKCVEDMKRRRLGGTRTQRKR